jgi:hypothetical protein
MRKRELIERWYQMQAAATIVINRANDAERLNFKYRCEFLHGETWRAEWRTRKP